MKSLAAFLTILSMVVMPCLAQDDAACVTETKALVDNNQAVEGAYKDMQSDLEVALKANPFSFCNVLNAECTINIQDYSSDLKTTCEAESGQLVEEDLVATCSGKVSDVTIPNDFTVTVLNAPLCAGVSCDPAALPSEIKNQIKTILDDVVKEIEAAVNGTTLMCDIQIGDGGANATPGDGGEATSAPATTSGSQATTIWVIAASVTLMSSILM
jgi:hypothetical protein